MLSFGAIYSVFLRNFLIWKDQWFRQICYHVMMPILMIYGLGYGLGQKIESIQGISYFDFIYSGFLVYAPLLSAFFFATFGYFARLSHYAIYESILVTPVKFSELVVGENVSTLFRSFIVLLFTMLIGKIMGATVDLGITFLVSVFVVLLTVWAICMISLLAISFMYRDDDLMISEAFIMPVFVFSGVFASLADFPIWVQTIGYLSPLYHAVEIVRLSLFENYVGGNILLHLLALALITFIFTIIGWIFFKKRLLNQ